MFRNFLFYFRLQDTLYSLLPTRIPLYMHKREKIKQALVSRKKSQCHRKGDTCILRMKGMLLHKEIALAGLRDVNFVGRGASVYSGNRSLCSSVCLENQSSETQEVWVSMAVFMSSDSEVRQLDQGQVLAPPCLAK